MSSENRFNKSSLPPSDFIYRTKCHPEAMGRQPLFGDQLWRFKITLEDDRILELQCGRECRDAFRNMFLQEDADDSAERLLGG